MWLEALLERLEQSTGTSGTPGRSNSVPARPAPIKASTGGTSGTALNHVPVNATPVLLEALGGAATDAAMEARRENVLSMLAADPKLKRAIYADFESDANNTILTIAIRDLGTCEMTVPKAKLDQWQLLALIDKAGADYIH